MSEKTILPYGVWLSPVTAGLISQRTRINDVQWSGDGMTLIWDESRSGKNVLVAQSENSARRDLTTEQAPRGGVGYGGGTFGTALHSDRLVFANSDGRLYQRGLGFEPPHPITPAIGTPAAGIASPTISPDGNWVVYVFSDGVTDLLGLANMNGSQWPSQLVRGADFYMQPAWHPAGDRLAWVEWNHPNMPWDGTRIQLATLAGSPPHIEHEQLVAGGDACPVQQPLFSPDGRWLSYIEETEDSEWENLMLYNLETGERRVLVKGEGFEIASPAWVQGERSTAWSPDSQRMYYFRFTGPNSSLWVVDLARGSSQQVDTAPYTAISQLMVSPVAGPKGDRLAFLASAPDQPTQVVRWQAGQIQIMAYSTAATYDPASLPNPREISWPTSDGETAYGLYYPPENPRFTGEGLPPAILHIHGGPTSIASNQFNGEAAYFTSRGYAYVEVNYRGGTGYGRSYRHAMRQRWGDVDVEDAASCARMLAEKQLADAGKLVITGGSAGGYTVLNTLIRFPGLFKAGVCLYGVANLFALDLDTHKFEKHYNASMIGPLPEAAPRYQAWSPVFHADKIRDALYIFQGSEDKVVPPNQAEEITSALRAHGTPYKFKLYEGEGHGFRKSETIADYLKETERFLQQFVLFAP